MNDTELRRVLIAAVDGLLVERSEISLAASLATVARRKPLSITQQRSAHRILTRSADKLAVAGLAVPALSVPVVPAPAVNRSAGNGPVIRMQWVVLNAGKDNERHEMRISVRSEFRFKDVLKAIPGALPSKDEHGFFWHYPVAPASAANILHALAGSNPQASPKVVELAQDFHGRQDAQAVLDESAPLPVFDTTSLLRPGFELWGHQRRSVEYGMNTVASLHAVPMGGGKTLATIATVNRTVAAVERGVTARVIIVCPNTVRGVWPREVRKFSAKTWHIVNGRKASTRSKRGFVDIAGAANRLAEAEACLFDCRCGAEIHAAVVNYDILSRKPWSTWSPKQRIDVAIYDEVHKLKAHSGVVSKVVSGWVSWTGKRIGLSGTPMPQTPLDIFGVYRALDPGIFGTAWTRFRSRYGVTNPKVEQHVIAYQNVAELAAKFFSICYRPTVDLDLPPVSDITRECVLEPTALTVYKSLDDELWADLGAFATNSPGVIGHEVESLTDIDPDSYGHGDSSTITPANVMVKLLRLQQLTGGTVIDDEGTRVRVSTAKSSLLAEVLDEVGCVRADGHEPEPVIVFCRFRSDLDVVMETAAAAGLSYGEVSGRRKTGLTADSEMAPVDVVAVQIQSGGTGVDFTRARVGIWYSLGYSLADYDQARKRMDRPGQTRPVVFVHLLAQGTADFDVYDALDSRRSVISSVMAANDVDPEALGFPAVDTVTVAEASGRAHLTGESNAVELPFERLIEAERVRVGAPQGKWKRDRADA